MGGWLWTVSKSIISKVQDVYRDQGTFQFGRGSFNQQRVTSLWRQDCGVVKRTRDGSASKEPACNTGDMGDLVS